MKAPSRTPAQFAAHRRELNRQLRIALLAGAEERSLERFGRSLTVEEMRRVIWAYPGDLPEERPASIIDHAPVTGLVTKSRQSQSQPRSGVVCLDTPISG
jgi:hypothetical protein